MSRGRPRYLTATHEQLPSQVSAVETGEYVATVTHGEPAAQVRQQARADWTNSQADGASVMQDSAWSAVACRGFPGSYLAVSSRHACTAAASVS
jgi:hypothetical protein